MAHHVKRLLVCPHQGPMHPEAATRAGTTWRHFTSRGGTSVYDISARVDRSKTKKRREGDPGSRGGLLQGTWRWASGRTSLRASLRGVVSTSLGCCARNLRPPLHPIPEDERDAEARMVEQLYLQVQRHPYHPHNQIQGKELRDDADTDGW
eukprot:8158697-Pyramimonas_sp.AAC.1